MLNGLHVLVLLVKHALRHRECNNAASFGLDCLGRLFVAVVGRCYIEVDDVLDILQSRRPASIPSMQHDNHVELPDGEIVLDRFYLVFRHVRGQNEGLQVEAIQEKLYPVGICDIVRIDHRFPFDDGKFDQREKQDKFVKRLLTESIEMLQLLELTDALLLGLHFDPQWFFQECVLYLFGVGLTRSRQDHGWVVFIENP
jgi:hypothetical protein